MRDNNEGDAPADEAVANSREHGGADPAGDADDQGSTTGDSDGGSYVGRVAGEDVGYAGETGAEARAVGRSSED